MNAHIVSPSGIAPGGVVVGDDGRIDRILAATETATADRIVDASGKLLFPGFVDAHVHMRDPGYPEKEDFSSGTVAAAVGGVTTVMCMPNTSPAVDGLDGVAVARRAGEARAHVDFALQGAITRTNLDDLGALWDSGVVSLEGLLSDAPENDRLDDPDLLTDALSRAAEIDALVGLYTGCQPMVVEAMERLQGSGRTDTRAFAEARPPLGESVGVTLVIDALSEIEARVVFRQVCTARGLGLLQMAKAQFPTGRISVEATPHNLLLNEEAMDRLGRHAQMIPPLRTEKDRAVMIGGVADGTVDFVGSDHAPHAPEQKEGETCWVSAGGVPGLDTITAAVMHLATTGQISFERVAEVLAATPARLFGLDHRKGAIAPGMDGDLVLVDPDRTQIVNRDMVRSRAGRSVFEGTELKGWPAMTLLRGNVIAEDGRFTGENVRGEWLPRKGAKSVAAAE